MLKTVTGASAPQAKQVNLADLPSVDRLLGLPSVSLLIAEHGREPVLKATRQLLAEARAGLLSGKQQMTDWSEAAFSDRLGRDLAAAMRPRLRAVFNLTGTVLHTNLGRALLPEEAVQAAATAMRSACNL